MSSKPRLWPNNAKHARDDSAKLLVNASHKLTRLTQNYFDIDDAARLRLISLANTDINKALRKLESVGAQTNS